MLDKNFETLTQDKLYMGHTLSARQRLRQVLSIHVDHGIFPRHVLTFQWLGLLAGRG